MRAAPAGRPLPARCPHALRPPLFCGRRPVARPPARRGTRRPAAVAVVAHGDHHSHGGRDPAHGHHHSPSHSHASCCGSHGDGCAGTAVGVAQSALDALLAATGLARAEAALDHSLRALAGAAACVAVAAALTPARAAALSAPPWTQPALVGAAYVLAGAPDVLDLGRLLACALPRPLGQGPGVAGARVDTHTLMAASALAAAAVGAPLEASEGCRGALLLVLFGASHALEARLTRAAAGDLGALLASSPAAATAVRLLPGDAGPDLASAVAVAASSLKVGDATLVRPGEAAAVDGVVLWGSALVSAEHITGEALPRRASVGDALPAGALAHDGALVLAATAVAGDSAPARIARLAADAQARLLLCRSKPKLSAWLDVAGAAYARGVLAASAAALAALLAAGVPLVGPPGTRGAAYRAMALLTAASPCALALAPLAYVAGVGAAARRGALLRGGGVLDALLGVGTVALDKTGTLTTGRLACVGQVEVGREGWGVGGGGSGNPAPDSLPAAPPAAPPAMLPARLPPPAGPPLALAAALSLRSSHPVAAATGAAAAAAGVAPCGSVLTDFAYIPGAGVRAGTPGGGSVLFGEAEWVGAAVGGVAGRAAVASAAAAAARSATVSVLAVLPAAVGRGGAPAPAPSTPPTSLTLFVFEDAVRAAAASAVADLTSGRATAGRPLAVRVLTGDNAAAAARVAAALGLPAACVSAGLSPADKVAAVVAAREAGGAAGRGGKPALRGVLMVGDGVNDAPALAAADVGAALAATPGGAAAAAADVLLLGGAGVEALPALLRIAAATRAVLIQNLALAALSVLLLAAPALAGALPLWAAVALHEGSTLAVALNSLRPLLAGGGHGEVWGWWRGWVGRRRAGRGAWPPPPPPPPDAEAAAAGAAVAAAAA